MENENKKEKLLRVAFGDNFKLPCEFLDRIKNSPIGPAMEIHIKRIKSGAFIKLFKSAQICKITGCPFYVWLEYIHSYSTTPSPEIIFESGVFVGEINIKDGQVSLCFDNDTPIAIFSLEHIKKISFV